MSSYTIRVELHDASWQQYIDLANDLARKGITDQILASDGNIYKMPPAEYNYEGNAYIDAVLDSVRESANKTRGLSPSPSSASGSDSPSFKLAGRPNDHQQ